VAPPAAGVELGEVVPTAGGPNFTRLLSVFLVKTPGDATAVLRSNSPFANTLGKGRLLATSLLCNCTEAMLVKR